MDPPLAMHICRYVGVRERERERGERRETNNFYTNVGHIFLLVFPRISSDKKLLKDETRLGALYRSLYMSMHLMQYARMGKELVYRKVNNHLISENFKRNILQSFLYMNDTCIRDVLFYEWIDRKIT